MKRVIRILLASMLALSMILSFVACSNLEMSDVKKALKKYAEKSDGEYFFQTAEKTEKKALEKAFSKIDDLKGGIEAAYTFGGDGNDHDDSSWCMIVEFEKSADAKMIEKNIEDELEDVMLYIAIDTAKSEAKEEGYSWDEYLEYYENLLNIDIEEQIKSSLEDTIPDNIHVERQGNIVFFGDKSIVKTAIKQVEKAAK